jgi:O-acetylhomoserine (thiol)-lyase
MKFATKALHTPFNKKDSHSALRMPIYDNAAYEGETSEFLEDAFRGNVPYHVYSRISNPTVEHFENTVKNLTGAQSVIALASGMAAISNVFLTIAQSGDNFITTSHLFGNTYSFFQSTMKSFGVEFRNGDLLNVDSLETIIDNNTKGIFFEALTNPQMEVADIRKLSALAKKHNLVIISDTTMLPLCFLDAKDLGIDIEVISSTKFISGGGTSIGGLILDHASFDWKHFTKLGEMVEKFGKLAFTAKLRKEIFKNLGACVSPHTAFLMSLGLETVQLRINESCKNAQILAEWLEKQNFVSRVNYPGLKSSPFHETSKSQFGGKFGSILTFELKNAANCFPLMDKLSIIRRATNINDNKSLIIHPFSTIYADYPVEFKLANGIPDTMMRLSVGLEDAEDLIDDLKAGFLACN